MYKKYIPFLLLLISTLSFGQNIHFQAIGVENGISQPTVTSIYQDEFGIIWIGTKDGLNRYNGTDFHIFRPIENDKNSLYNNNIGTICGDKNGHIYIRCKYAVVEYDIKKNIFHTIRNNNIQAIDYGNSRLWVCTRDSLFTYNRKEDKLEYYYHLDSVRISCVTEDHEGNLYVGTMNKGLYIIDSNKKWLNYLPEKDITCIYEDSKKNIWVGTKDDGLFRLDRNGVQINYKDGPYKNRLSSNYIRCIVEDNQGNYWIGTFKGLDKLDTTNNITHYSEDNKPYSLSNSSIICMMKDQQGTFWIGTYYGGINLFNPDYEIYTYYYPDESQKGKLTSPFAGRMKEDSKGGIWIATEGGGVNYLDRKTKSFIEYKHSNQSNSLASNTIQALYLDEKNQILWIGTLKGGLDKLNLKTQKFTNYRHVPGQKNTLINDIIRKIIPYKGNLLLATHNGIGLFNPETGECTKLLTDSKLNNRQIIDMHLDKHNNLWFSYYLGLVKYNIATHKRDEYFVPNTSEKVIGSNLINVLFEDKKGNIWAGSSGDGIFLYQPETNTFKSFNSQNSDLINDYILDINESLSGYLLIASNQGFSRFDMENERFYNYNKQNGFPMTALNPYGLFVAHDNEIFLSGPKMMISFFEKELNSYVKPYQLNFTSLEVNNKLILPNDGSGILSESILYQPQITLNHNHSIITVNFSLSNYVSVLRNRIYYKLEGFDKDWMSAGYRKGITYTNLNPGKYKLIIKSSEEYSGRESICKEIDIVIKPPFYKSTWAYCLYGIIIIISIYIIVSFYSSKLKLRASLEYEKKEKKQIEELNQSKLRFFTNISHEFRTPLTLIVSQLEMLMERNDIQPLVYGKLVGIHRNTLRMKRLITELLDFRKQEQGFEKFKYSKQDIYSFLEEIYLSFKEYARGKQIIFEYFNKDRSLDVWFDVVQLEKVIYNLLSNAFKYTPLGGTVSLSVQEYENSVMILISDTGIGIAEENLNKIFDRFYQEEHSSTDYIGSGIGMHIVKEYVTLHNGDIQIRDNHPQGTIFEFMFPIRHECKNINPTATPTERPDIQEEPEQAKTPTGCSLLIVEDNEDFRQFIVDCLKDRFTVYEAEQGEKAMEILALHDISLVISDVRMPIMNGLELCNKIKGDFRYSHIPVILLTARTAQEHMLEGLREGADDYITKPFNLDILLLRIQKLLEWSSRNHQRFGKVEVSPAEITISTIDERLIERAIQAVEENMDNTDFSVEDLSMTVGMSRGHLYKKLMTITGKSPLEFIRVLRIKRGKQLLEQSQESISQIAYQVGLSPKQFAKYFKEEFGCLPSEFNCKKD